MNRYIAIGLSVAAALLLAACTRSHKGTAAAAPEESGSAYHKITAEEAKEMMDSGDVTVVDVRRAEEYEQAHIPGAVLVPNDFGGIVDWPYETEGGEAN